MLFIENQKDTNIFVTPAVASIEKWLSIFLQPSTQWSQFAHFL